MDSKALLGNCQNRMYVGEFPDIQLLHRNALKSMFHHAHKMSVVSWSMFQGDRTQVMEKRFREFLLVAENAEAVLGARVDTAREGSYQLLGDVLTRFSDHCTNTGMSSVMTLD